MASTSETGHAKNSANFRRLIDVITSFGSIYQPSKASLAITQLNQKQLESQDKLNAVIAKNTIYNGRVNERIVLFKGNQALYTKLINALQATDATPEKIKNAKVFYRKLKGKRAVAIPTSLDPNQPAPTTISASQLSYDNQIQHFAGFIAVLESEPSYAPNETELQVVSLQAKMSEMKLKNNAVSTAHVDIRNVRIERNKNLYEVDNGIIDTAADVKNYVKSVFGASSQEFKLVRGIEFRKQLR